MKNEEKGYIKNKDMAKEVNKWSSWRSRRKIVNVMLYDVILQLRKLMELLRS